MRTLSLSVLGSAALAAASPAHALAPVWLTPGSSPATTSDAFQPQALLDAEGDLYLVNAAKYDGAARFVISIDKRDPDGAQLYCTEHELELPRAFVVDAAFDGAGQLWVAGYADVAGGPTSGFIAAFDAPTGEPVFETFVPGNSLQTSCRELAADAAGRMTVACTDSLDSLIRVYTQAFDLAWSARIPAVTRAHLAPAANGELYVAGVGRLGTQPIYDYAAARFTAAGSKLWQRSFDLVGQMDFVLDAAASPTGDLITTGVSCPSQASGLPCELYTLRLKRTNGGIKWSRRTPLTLMPSYVNNLTARSHLAIASGGDAVVSVQDFVGGTSQLMLARFRGDSGAAVWTQRLPAFPYGMDLDADDDAWVVSTSRPKTLYTFSFASGAMLDSVAVGAATSGVLYEVVVDDASERAYIGGIDTGVTLIGAYE